MNTVEQRSNHSHPSSFPVCIRNAKSNLILYTLHSQLSSNCGHRCRMEWMIHLTVKSDKLPQRLKVQNEKLLQRLLGVRKLRKMHLAQ